MVRLTLGGAVPGLAGDAPGHALLATRRLCPAAGSSDDSHGIVLSLLEFARIRDSENIRLRLEQDVRSLI